MATLYELTGSLLELERMLYDPEANGQMLKDTMEAVEGEFEAKADGYAKIIRRMQADVNDINLEIKRLTERRNSIADRAYWLKNSLENAMRATGKRKFKTALFSFGIQRNGGKEPLVIDDKDAVPEEFLIPQPPKIDGEAVREYLEKHTAEWAHLEERGESLRIR